MTNQGEGCCGGSSEEKSEGESCDTTKEDKEKSGDDGCCGGSDKAEEKSEGGGSCG